MGSKEGRRRGGRRQVSTELDWSNEDVGWRTGCESVLCDDLR